MRSHSVTPVPLTLIVPTNDGALYFIRPGSSCIDRIDIGGRVYVPNAEPADPLPTPPGPHPFPCLVSYWQIRPCAGGPRERAQPPGPGDGHGGGRGHLPGHAGPLPPAPHEPAHLGAAAALPRRLHGRLRRGRHAPPPARHRQLVRSDLEAARGSETGQGGGVACGAYAPTAQSRPSH